MTQRLKSERQRLLFPPPLLPPRVTLEDVVPEVDLLAWISSSWQWALGLMTCVLDEGQELAAHYCPTIDRKLTETSFVSRILPSFPLQVSLCSLESCHCWLNLRILLRMSQSGGRLYYDIVYWVVRCKLLAHLLLLLWTDLRGRAFYASQDCRLWSFYA